MVNAPDTLGTPARGARRPGGTSPRARAWLNVEATTSTTEVIAPPGAFTMDTLPDTEPSAVAPGARSMPLARAPPITVTRAGASCTPAA